MKFIITLKIILLTFMLNISNLYAMDLDSKNIEDYKNRNIIITGKTYSVIEKDILEVIKNKFNTASFKERYKNDLSSLLSYALKDKGEILPPSTKDYSYTYKFNYSIKEDIKVDSNNSSLNILKGTNINPIEEFKKKYSFILNSNSLIPDLIVFNPCSLEEVKVLKNVIINLRKNNRPYKLISSGCSQKDILKLNLNIPIYSLDKEMVKTFNLKNTLSLIKTDFLNNQFKIQVFKVTDNNSLNNQNILSNITSNSIETNIANNMENKFIRN